MNWGKNLPRDAGGGQMQDFPAPVLSQARFIDENGVASSVISLNPNSTNVEVGAFGGQGAVLRWVPATETAAAAGAKASVVASGLGANFDHFIPAGTIRRFVIPKETGGIGPGGLAGAQAGSVHGLYQRMARINAGATASSVIVAEY